MANSKYPYEKCTIIGAFAEFETDKPLRFVQIATATYGRRRGMKFKVSKVAASEGGTGLLLRMERVG